MLHCAPRYGQTNIVVYVGICSVIGSLTVNHVHYHTFETNFSLFFMKFFYAFLLLGNEHQGGRHCYQAYNWGYKPGWLFPNLVVCNYFSYMHSYSVSLPEQGAVWINFKIYVIIFMILIACSHYVERPGIGHFQYCGCFSRLLCDVHIPHNFSKCHNVQGMLILRNFHKFLTFWSFCWTSVV